MRVCVVVPFRAVRDLDRHAAWSHVQAHWQVNGFEVHTADDGGEPFSRGCSVNRGIAEHPGADVYVIADADSLVDEKQVRAAVQAAAEAPGIVIAFDRFAYLSRDGTRAVMSGDRGDWNRHVEWTLQRSVSTCLAVSRETWEQTGGFDPRFRGWGMEDVAFEITARTVSAPTRHIPGTAWHLWHPPEPLRPAGNVQLLREYEAAAGDPAAVREVRAAAGDPVRIPRKVHRVWLGPAVPKYDFAEEWADTNPGWELVTWRDADAAQLDLVCQAEYDAAPTYVHRADILLVEAIYADGGVAVGWDMEPLRPLDPLLADVSAFCTPDADGFPGQAFFGAVPGHRSMSTVLQQIPRRIRKQGWGQPHIDTGPYLWGAVFGRTGQFAPANGIEILGDHRTAYPVRYWEKQYFDQPEVYAQLTQDSYLVHRFQHSWANLDDVKVKEPV